MKESWTVTDDITWKELATWLITVVGGLFTAIIGLLIAFYRATMSKISNMGKSVGTMAQKADEHESRLQVIETQLEERNKSILDKLERMDSGAVEWRETFNARLDNLSNKMDENDRDMQRFYREHGHLFTHRNP